MSAWYSNDPKRLLGCPSESRGFYLSQWICLTCQALISPRNSQPTQLCSMCNIASTGMKYGGLAPKKKPLISKDNARAFFDSADWALCKQGAGVDEKSTHVVETLRPKLKRTPRQQLPPRRPACTSGPDGLAE